MRGMGHIESKSMEYAETASAPLTAIKSVTMSSKHVVNRLEYYYLSVLEY